MLDEVGANFAVMEALAKAAQGQIRVWQDRSIALLDDEAIEKSKAVVRRVVVGLKASLVFYARHLDDCGNTFEVDGGRVTRCLGLVVVDEGAGLVLLITEEPICDFENEVRERLLLGDVPPFAEGLQ